jgi:hypothetical protein
MNNVVINFLETHCEMIKGKSQTGSYFTKNAWKPVMMNCNKLLLISHQ